MLCTGGYRDALRFRPNEQITFDPDAFIISRPASMQPFLKKALHLQTFQQFVSDRLDMLNAGQGFSDEFDQQVNLYGDRWGAQSRYKDWLNHMKV
jgi:DENN domain-containing protein 1